jgi:hypothetical protein
MSKTFVLFTLSLVMAACVRRPSETPGSYSTYGYKETPYVAENTNEDDNDINQAAPSQPDEPQDEYTTCVAQCLMAEIEADECKRVCREDDGEPDTGIGGDEIGTDGGGLPSTGASDGEQPAAPPSADAPDVTDAAQRAGIRYDYPDGWAEVAEDAPEAGFIVKLERMSDDAEMTLKQWTLQGFTPKDAVDIVTARQLVGCDRSNDYDAPVGNPFVAETCPDGRVVFVHAASVGGSVYSVVVTWPTPPAVSGAVLRDFVQSIRPAE